MIGINESSSGVGERLDLEFPQGTDNSELIENAYFMDLISSKIKHELTRLLTTAGAGYKTIPLTKFLPCKNHVRAL